MQIHNLMEDIVFKYIDQIIEEKQYSNISSQNKIDMACYALNRLPARYVASSRGVVHSENENRENQQRNIDIISIVVQAVEIISKRRGSDAEIPEDQALTDDTEEALQKYFTYGYYFNFPHIVGRIIDSNTFMPIKDATVALNYEVADILAPTFSSQWKNPVHMVAQMNGTFTFWPAPIKADTDNIEKVFIFNLKIEKAGYETVKKCFEVQSTSTKKLYKYVTGDNIIHIGDIFLYTDMEEKP